MSEISKPDYTYLWSSGGAIVAPSNVKVQTGWTAEVPPFQWENWSQNRQDQAISHILQKGISVWSATGEYWFTTSGERSYVQGSDGNIYVAVADSVGQNPTTDVSDTYWTLAFSRPTGLSRFTASGSFTVPPFVTTIWVSGCAGGGGGGSSLATNSTSFVTGGSGGGAGQPVIRVPITVTPGQVIPVVVGGGGVGASGALNNATSGTNTQLGAGGSLLNLVGGSPGQVGTGGTTVPQDFGGPGGGPGFPGGGTASDTNVFTATTASGGFGGVGAAGPFGAPGAAGRGAANASTNAVAGTGFGAGGSGAGGAYKSSVTAPGAPGAAGLPGILIIEW